MNMGAGRIVYQDLTRIDKSIRDGEFFESPALAAAMDRVRATAGTRCTSSACVSDGGVHSHQRHLHALIEMAARRKVPQRVRARHHRRPRHVADRRRPLRRRARGRDAPGRRRPRSRRSSGRYYAMDRDKRWERTKLAYDAIVARRARDATTPDRARGDAERRTTPASPTSSSSRSSIVDADGAAGRTDARRRLGHRSSTSAPTARGRSRARSRSTTSTASTAPDRPHVHYDDDDGVRPDVRPARRRSRRRRSAATSRTCSPRTAGRTCGWPRPRSTRTSPTSSTAGARSRTRARIASSSRRRRSRPTT